MKNTTLKALVLSIVCISILGIASGASALSFSDKIKPDSNDVIFETELKDLINPILLWIFGIIGLICVIMVVYGGVKITTSGEKDDQRKKGIQTLTWAIIGLIITLVSYSIVAIVGSGVIDSYNTTK